jgi:hypothetical protein
MRFAQAKVAVTWTEFILHASINAIQTRVIIVTRRLGLQKTAPVHNTFSFIVFFYYPRQKGSGG